MRHLGNSAIVLLLVGGCGASVPTRYVLEHDLDDFSYRRYQKVLDTEIVVPDNDSVGHTATYVRRDRGETVAFATAFVTVYERARALTAEVRERLKRLESYRMFTRDMGGGYAWILDGGEQERWTLWVSGRFLVKIGAPAGEDFAEPVVDAYMSLYPSDLTEHGHAEEGSDSAGMSRAQREETDDELEMPGFLREGAPR